MVLFECNPRFFMRVTACRLLGLDFVRAGLGMPTATTLTTGDYFGAHSRALWREALTDPIPLLLRRLSRVDKTYPDSFLLRNREERPKGIGHQRGQ
jgi:hypothetical protein